MISKVAAFLLFFTIYLVFISQSLRLTRALSHLVDDKWFLQASISKGAEMEQREDREVIFILTSKLRNIWQIITYGIMPSEGPGRIF